MGVLENDEHSFEDGKEKLIPHALSFKDGITRRSPKRSQATQPPLERRGAQSECRALDVQLRKHGRLCASAEFLRPRGVFSKFCSPLDYASATFKVFQKVVKSVPHDRRTVLYSEWGRKARREGGGGNKIPRGT